MFKKVKLNKQKELYKKLAPFFVVIIVLFILKNFLKSVYNSIINYFRMSGSKITDATAETLSNRLKVAFTNTLPYSAFDEVKSIFVGLDLADYYKVKDSFGLVPRHSITGAPASGLGDIIFGIDLNLNEWLVHELNSEQMEELKEVNSLFVKIF